MREQDCWSLLENEAFVEWVLHPNKTSDQYWEAWIRQDSSRAPQVAQARDILKRLAPSQPIDTRPMDIWQGVQQRLQADRTLSTRPYRPIWTAAAACLLLVGAGLLYRYTHSTASAARPVAAAVIHSQGPENLQYRNSGTHAEKVYLVDGSVITLEPNSSLSYPRFLDRERREVTLRGNAFFEIARDPNRPFLVRSGDIVTQVLGTSFRVIADPGKDDIHVAVRTGKVSVYKSEDFDRGHEAFCVLLPYQEAVFHKKEQNLAFVPNAGAQIMVPPVAEALSMNFDDVPVTNILDQLGKMYHIHIQYDRDSLQQCRLTTSLQEEKLTDKLDIICKAINANYRTRDNDIIIDGGHCQN